MPCGRPLLGPAMAGGNIVGRFGLAAATTSPHEYNSLVKSVGSTGEAHHAHSRVYGDTSTIKKAVQDYLKYNSYYFRRHLR